jgi:polygalacturonase
MRPFSVGRTLKYMHVHRKVIRSVGPQDADFIGTDNRAIQQAIEEVSQHGGGVVHLREGIFTLRNSIFLRSGVKLSGEGDKTVLRKTPSRRTALVDDTDWYEARATVANPDFFEPGDGIVLQSMAAGSGIPQTTKHTVLEINGNELILDKQPRLNHWLSQEPSAARLFPIITANNAVDLAVENLAIDGNRGANEKLNGNYGGGLFFLDCARISMCGLLVHDYHGDGISWQVCDDVAVENCRILQCSDSALHPGSGSQRPVIRGNSLEHCRVGIYWCWGVRHGIAEGNCIRFTSEAAISIGHRDTDNVIRDNRIEEGGLAAIEFRAEESDAWLAHRTMVEGNTITNVGSGTKNGVGIQLCRGLRDVTLRDNRMICTNGLMREAIEIPEGIQGLVSEGNTLIRR